MSIANTFSPLAISIAFFIHILFFSSSIFSQGFQLSYGNVSSMDSETRKYLFENDVRKKFIFMDSISDLTSYPFFETNISLTLGEYSFIALNREGKKINYSKRGENKIFHACNGDVCLLLTDRNFLAISNHANEWSRASFFGEERIKAKLGNKAAFIVTERAVYFFNGYINEWTRIGLESEEVTAVSNKNELAVIVTSKRAFFIQLPNALMKEIDVTVKPIGRYEIRSGSIEIFSYDRVFQYDSRDELVTEMRTDR